MLWIVLSLNSSTLSFLSLPLSFSPSLTLSSLSLLSDLLSVLLEHELCSSSALSKMSPICRLVCQTACGLFRAAQQANHREEKGISLNIRDGERGRERQREREREREREGLVQGSGSPRSKREREWCVLCICMGIGHSLAL